MEKNRLLLLPHHGLGRDYLLSPPGGGMQLGEPAVAALQREFLEEVGLHVAVRRLCFVHEHRGDSLHAVELFFEVHCADLSTLGPGSDPETADHGLAHGEPLWCSAEQLAAENPKNLHAMLRHHPDPATLVQLQGYFLAGQEISA